MSQLVRHQLHVILVQQIAKVILRHERHARSLLSHARPRQERLRVVWIHRVNRRGRSEKRIRVRRFGERHVICAHSLAVNRIPAIRRDLQPRNAKAEQVGLHRIVLLENKVMAIISAPLFSPAPGSYDPESTRSLRQVPERDYNLQLKCGSLARGTVTDHPCFAVKRRHQPRVALKPFDASSRSRLKFEARSEEHTSELQSRRDLVCRLLLEKKKKQK